MTEQAGGDRTKNSIILDKDAIPALKPLLRGWSHVAAALVSLVAGTHAP